MTCVESRHTISGSITQPHRNQKFPLLLLLPHLLPQTSLHHFEHPPKKKWSFLFSKESNNSRKKEEKAPSQLGRWWLTGCMTHWAENQKKKRRQPWPRCVHPGERERERLVGVILSFVSLTLAAAAPGDMTGPHQTAAGQWERSRRFLKKESLYLPTWATHAKKTHTQEREGETRCRQITAAHKVGQTGGGGGFDVVPEEIVHHEKKKMANTHTHVPGTTLGLDVCTRPKNMCLQSHPGNLWKGK